MQLVGQQRTITSYEQHSVMEAPVAGSRHVMQLATVVLPFGKKVPDLWVVLSERARLQEVDKGAGRAAYILTANDDVPRTNQIDAVGGATAIDDDGEATVTCRQARNLDGGANDVCARRKYASRGH